MTSNSFLAPISEDVVGEFPPPLRSGGGSGGSSNRGSNRGSNKGPEEIDPFAKYIIPAEEVEAYHSRLRSLGSDRSAGRSADNLSHRESDRSSSLSHRESDRSAEQSEDPFAKYIIPDAEVPSTIFRPHKPKPQKHTLPSTAPSITGNLLKKINKNTANAFTLHPSLSNPATRSLFRAATALIGVPRSIEDLLSATNNYISGEGFKSGFNSPEGRKHIFPSAAELQELSPDFFDQHAKGVLGFVEDATQSILEVASFGGLGSLAKTIGFTALGTGAEKLSKAFGASDQTQALVGLGAMALSSLKSPTSAQSFMKNLLNEAEAEAATLPELPSAISRSFREDMSKATHSFKASKAHKKAFSEVIKMSKAAKSPVDLVQLRRQANDAFPAVRGTGGVEVHGNVVKAIDKALDTYSKHSKLPSVSKWHDSYKDATQVAKVFYSTRAGQDRMAEYLRKIPKTSAVHALASALHFIPGTTLAVGSIVGAGKGLLAGNTVLQRVLANPTWASYYKKAMQQMLSNNAAGAYKTLEHLYNVMEEEDS